MERLPTSPRGAVLAVSHDFDGFVRRRPCGLVASHYRPWGLPGFEPTADVTADTRPSSRTTDPSELFPPDEGESRHHTIAGVFTGTPAPLAVGALPVLRSDRNRTDDLEVPPPQGFPRRESVAPPTHCSAGQPDAPLGFSSTSGSHPSVPLATSMSLGSSSPCSVRGCRRHLQSGAPAEANPPKPATRSLLVLSPSLAEPKLRSCRRRVPGPCASCGTHPHAARGHRAGALAFQTTPLPARPWPKETKLRVSTVVPACRS